MSVYPRQPVVLEASVYLERQSCVVFQVPLWSCYSHYPQLHTPKLCNIQLVISPQLLAFSLSSPACALSQLVISPQLLACSIPSAAGAL